MPTPSVGYQPRNTPAERRAFFDAQRCCTEHTAQIAALQAALEALTARVTDLESP